ncbi:MULTISPECIES: hypothetical protein [unclassified Microbacterium]|uniref:hypothetical protein n=1 Tax=unclassified Microbacterium TaxID=2609290 RepID=UPI0030177419
MAATLKNGGAVLVSIVPDTSRFEAAMREVGEHARRVAASIRGFVLGIPFAKPPARERRAQRRADAMERQERYDNTPTFDKLAAIQSRPGESKRERARLLATALA